MHIEYTEDGGSTTILDIAVPCLRLAIEADEPRCTHSVALAWIVPTYFALLAIGPRHFIRDIMNPLGTALARNRLLESEG